MSKTSIIEIDILDDKLTISIGISTLRNAAKLSDIYQKFPELTIPNENTFAESIIELLSEVSPHGTTAVTRILDEAIIHVASMDLLETELINDQPLGQNIEVSLSVH